MTEKEDGEKRKNRQYDHLPAWSSRRFIPLKRGTWPASTNFAPDNLNVRD
jgi:hypothetical protein